MAGFFSLGSAGGGAGGGSSSSAPGRPTTTNNSPPHVGDDHPHALFWPYKNEPPKPSFELWQSQEPHHHQQFLYRHQDLFTSAAALGVGPGHEDHHARPNSAASGSGGGGGGGVSCQDCGNQAKKDCVHMRCRTCCKSRGLECQTHVKSTWVPASKRRERQQLLQQQHHHDHRHGHDQQVLQITAATKRLRDSSTHPSNALTPRLPSSSSGLEVGNFPAEVSSNAVFRCVRVSSVDSAEDQYAYQTAVSIGGHLFKGILLDHGPETTANYSTSTIGGETSSGGGGGGGGVSQPLDLITTTAAAATGQVGSGQFVDPSALYQVATAQPINAYAIAGTQFFLPPRS